MVEVNPGASDMQQRSLLIRFSVTRHDPAHAWLLDVSGGDAKMANAAVLSLLNVLALSHKGVHVGTAASAVGAIQTNAAPRKAGRPAAAKKDRPPVDADPIGAGGFAPETVTHTSTQPAARPLVDAEPAKMEPPTSVPPVSTEETGISSELLSGSFGFE